MPLGAAGSGRIESLSDFKVWSRYVYTANVELLTSRFDIFNEMTNGGFQYSTGALNQGDYTFMNHTKVIPDYVQEIDMHETTANMGIRTSVPTASLEHGQINDVKIARTSRLMFIPPGLFTWINRSPGEAAMVIAENESQQMMKDCLDRTIEAFKGAMQYSASGNADHVTQVTSKQYYPTVGSGSTEKPAPFNLDVFVDLQDKMGDMMGDISCWVMHSGCATRFWKKAIGDKQTLLFNWQGIRVMGDQWGRPFVIIDHPGLKGEIQIGSGPVKQPVFYILGLKPGAVRCELNYDYAARTDDSLDGSRLMQRRYQSNWTYNMSVDQFAWGNDTSRIKSPTNAELASANRWQPVTSTPPTGFTAAKKTEFNLDMARHLPGVIGRVHATD